MDISAKFLGKVLFALVLLCVAAIFAIGGHLVNSESRFQRQSEAINEIGELISRLSTSQGLAYSTSGVYRNRLFIGGNKVLTRVLALSDDNGWGELSRLNLGAQENLANFSKAFRRQANPAYIDALYRQSLLQLNLMMDKAGEISSKIHLEQFERIRRQIVYLGILGAIMLAVFAFSVGAFFRGFVNPVVRTAAQLRDGLPPISTDDRPGAVIELRDLIQALHESRDKLETKNVELERVIYTVSHELKTPLVTISGFAGLLERDVKEGATDSIVHDINQICAAVDMMSLLLDDLLEILRAGHIANNPEAVSLDELVRLTLNSLEPQIAESKIDVRVSQAMPTVYADPLRLREVLQNLIDNAIKFTRDRPGPWIEIGARIKNGEAICNVCDNGIGVEPEYHDKIFGLFERLGQEVPGSGVGLALVKRIVENDRGRIWVESEGLNRGSCFYFSVSLAKQDPG